MRHHPRSPASRAAHHSAAIPRRVAWAGRSNGRRERQQREHGVPREATDGRSLLKGTAEDGVRPKIESVSLGRQRGARPHRSSDRQRCASARRRTGARARRSSSERSGTGMSPSPARGAAVEVEPPLAPGRLRATWNQRFCAGTLCCGATPRARRGRPLRAARPAGARAGRMRQTATPPASRIMRTASSNGTPGAARTHSPRAEILLERQLDGRHVTGAQKRLARCADGHHTRPADASTSSAIPVPQRASAPRWRARALCVRHGTAPVARATWWTAHRGSSRGCAGPALRAWRDLDARPGSFSDLQRRVPVRPPPPGA